MSFSEASVLKRIAIVGPECTGKTVLSRQLAQQYNTEWVPEFARQYLDQINRPYEQHDLLKIAKWQITLEDELALMAKDYLFCDTNLLVIKVWSEFKYGTCDAEILALLHKRSYDLHLLTNIDIPWEFDPQREHPHKREELFNIYESELQKLKVPYTIVSGSYDQRLQHATKAIENLS